MTKQEHNRSACRLMVEVLKELNPSVYQACFAAVTPLMTDLSIIGRIKDIIEQREGPTTTENIHLLIGVLDRIFVPAQLIKGDLVKKPIGLRDAYAALFSYENPENINSWVDRMRAHYKNKRFANKVDKIAFEIVERFRKENICHCSVPDPSSIPVVITGQCFDNVMNFINRSKTGNEGAESALLY